MLIISQDKKQVVNLDNITRIFIDELEDDKNKKYCIGADTNSAESMVWELGEYKTEERAKEVLQEIMKQKAMFALFRTAPTGGKEQTEMLEKFAQKKIIFDTYEMPGVRS